MSGTYYDHCHWSVLCFKHVKFEQRDSLLLDVTGMSEKVALNVPCLIGPGFRDFAVFCRSVLATLADSDAGVTTTHMPMKASIINMEAKDAF